jgi:hypothetical protein
VANVPPAVLEREQPGEATLTERPAYDLIELFFFAYRDFVSDPDRILADYGFGRAHHRVLHFVDRQPGLMIAELLDILRITKQSSTGCSRADREGFHRQPHRNLRPTPAPPLHDTPGP